MKILFTGGGTGGHIYPILSIIREIKEKTSLYYIGPKGNFGLRELQEEGVMIKTISAGKLRRYKKPLAILKNIFDIIFKIPIGVISASLALNTIRPDVIFCKGGFGSFPVIIANKLFKFPLFVHESDSVAGKATNLAAKDAVKIFTSFENTEIIGNYKNKIICVGNPIRKNLLLGSAKEAKEMFNITEEKPLILIMGGSQGAEEINELILPILPELLKNFEIIHQCGTKNFDKTDLLYRTIIEEESLDKYYHLFDFLNEEQMAQSLAAAHLVISRAGAAAISEIAATGKPSILIPLLNSAQNHQAKNAYLYAGRGAANILEPENPTPHMLYSKLIKIFSNPEQLKQMKKAALGFAKIEAGEKIAKYLTSYK
jgi:UDP-N-acetylglucosamine--N-acetylmuramyl-(pentapeptide) pyrophosphoryl-undecaprenol N-acetylglucosamine transferase